MGFRCGEDRGGAEEAIWIWRLATPADLEREGEATDKERESLSYTVVYW